MRAEIAVAQHDGWSCGRWSDLRGKRARFTFSPEPFIVQPRHFIRCYYCIHLPFLHQFLSPIVRLSIHYLEFFAQCRCLVRQPRLRTARAAAAAPLPRRHRRGRVAELQKGAVRQLARRARRSRRSRRSRRASRASRAPLPHCPVSSPCTRRRGSGDQHTWAWSLSRWACVAPGGGSY